MTCSRVRGRPWAAPGTSGKRGDGCSSAPRRRRNRGETPFETAGVHRCNPHRPLQSDQKRLVGAWLWDDWWRIRHPLRLRPPPERRHNHRRLIHHSARSKRQTTSPAIARQAMPGQSRLGSGTNGEVAALALLPDGELIVHGGFNRAGDLAVGGFARYEFTSGGWSPLDRGTNGQVSSMLVLPGGDLILGGEFTVIGGTQANYVARYNPATNTWSSLGTGTPSDSVTAMALLPVQR